MKGIYTVLFLLMFSCTSVPKHRTAPVVQQPPKGSSGSLGKNIDELDTVMNKSLSRIDKILSELGGNK
jgi:hypothetical protein